jgi:hypothetical protein
LGGKKKVKCRGIVLEWMEAMVWDWDLLGRGCPREEEEAEIYVKDKSVWGGEGQTKHSTDTHSGNGNGG